MLVSDQLGTYLLEEVARGVAFEEEEFPIASSLNTIVSLLTIAMALYTCKELFRVTGEQLCGCALKDLLGVLIELAIEHRLKVLVLCIVDISNLFVIFSVRKDRPHKSRTRSSTSTRIARLH
jgi:hypothetical protein